MAITVSTKKVRNLLQSSLEKNGNLESGGETMLLMVLNKLYFFIKNKLS